MSAAGHPAGIAQHARALLARRDVVARQLAELDRDLDAARRSYSFAKGYRVPIRAEAFKREVEA